MKVNYILSNQWSGEFLHGQKIKNILQYLQYLLILLLFFYIKSNPCTPVLYCIDKYLFPAKTENGII